MDGRHAVGACGVGCRCWVVVALVVAVVVLVLVSVVVPNRSLAGGARDGGHTEEPGSVPRLQYGTPTYEYFPIARVGAETAETPPKVWKKSRARRRRAPKCHRKCLHERHGSMISMIMCCNKQFCAAPAQPLPDLLATNDDERVLPSQRRSS